MRRRSHFPPGESPAAAAPLSLWRLVHLRRLDLILAIYGTLALAAKQRLWPRARQALTEAPRKRLSALKRFQAPLAKLMKRLRITQRLLLGAQNGLF
jgi:hypothetical protein